MRNTIDALKQRYDPRSNPYLVALADGSMSRDDFIETQIQFLFAVVFFSRPMAALAGRLPRPQMRVALIENIRDEHGDGRLTVCHENTFLELLARLGVDRDYVDSRTLWPEVRAFNTVLSGLCTLDDALTGLAALGMIEDLFSAISASIGRSIVKRGFLPKEQVVHYTTHEKLDVQHAEGFYSGLYESYAKHPRLRYEIDQGLEMGAYIFTTMYEGLYRARDRRWTRDVRGPHSVADGWYVERR
ncbi:MAG: TenA family transcriptional regulator [Polyangiales bacterium]